MKNGVNATLPKEAEKSPLSSEDQAVLNFFIAMTNELSKEKGEMSKASFLNAALLAAPSPVRDELCTALKETPPVASGLKRKETSDNVVPTALVSTGALYLVKKKAIPLLVKGVPAALSFIPGAGAVPYVIEVAELATEFSGELFKGYIAKHEADQNKKIYDAADNQLAQLASLLKDKVPTEEKQPALAEPRLLTFSGEPSVPLLMQTAANNNENQKAVKALNTLRNS